MGIIKLEDIRGISREGKIYCAGCGPDDFVEEEVLTESTVDDNEHVYFCDECGKRL